MSDTRQKIEGLHGLYVRLTGLQIRLDMGREADWFHWIKRGFTAEDLAAVVAHLKRGIKEERRQPGCLRFRNLIGQVDFFEEDLAEARQVARGARKVDEGRAGVLRASGRVISGEVISDQSRKVGEVIESKAFKEFVKLKERIFTEGNGGNEGNKGA